MVFSSDMVCYPEAGISVAITSNGLNYSMNDILIGILSIYNEIEFEVPQFTTVTLSDEELGNFEGTYECEEINLLIEIWNEEGQIRAQATGQGQIGLETQSKNTLINFQYGLKMVFDGLKDGSYQSFVNHQAGMEFTFVRTEN